MSVAIPASCIKFLPASNFCFEHLGDVWNSVFDDDMKCSPLMNDVTIARLVEQDGIDLSVSRVIALDHPESVDTDMVPLGLVLISRRRTTSWVTALGCVPLARRCGLGSLVMDRLVEEAQERGDSVIKLECISENTAARKLCASMGFILDRFLAGWIPSGPQVLTDLTMERMPRQTLSATSPVTFIDESQLSDISLQEFNMTVAKYGGILTRATVVHLYGTKAFRMGPAYIAITNPFKDSITLLSLVVDPQHRRQGHGRRIMGAVLRRYNGIGKRWCAESSSFPEESTAFIQAIGFRRITIEILELNLETV